MTHDFYIYGRNAIVEQLQNNPKNLKRIMIKDGLKDRAFEEIRKLAQANRIPVQTTDEKEIAKLLKDEVSHQGIIALSKPFEYTNFDEWTATIKESDLPTVIILDHIQDVSNLGAIIRSATAAGVDAIIVAELNQAPITSAVYKTSTGTVGRIPVIQVGNLNQIIEKLKKKGFWVAGLGMEGSTNLWDYKFDTPTALVIGGEGMVCDKRPVSTVM
jgi:23S rRNA (guanosine2251-2'-O)-methyltransferase